MKLSESMSEGQQTCFPQEKGWSQRGGGKGLPCFVIAYITRKGCQGHLQVKAWQTGRKKKTLGNMFFLFLLVLYNCVVGHKLPQLKNKPFISAGKTGLKS